MNLPFANAIPAATLILMRDQDAAPPAIMMIERAATMAFAAGARVFPGGRVDEDDKIIAASLGDDMPYDTPHRIAAIRETIEEVGLAVALDPLPDHDIVNAMRADLANGRAFSELLVEHGLTPDLDALLLFARWCPPPSVAPRAFDTHFYAAKANHLPMNATVDGSETVHLVWTSAEQALQDAEEGIARIVFPTLCNLEKIGQAGNFDELVAHVETYPVELIQPLVGEIDGEQVLRIPEDRGYPRTWRALNSIARF
nr:NUDIX domain-containing protein [Aquisediminimonas sediminicola]